MIVGLFHRILLRGAVGAEDPPVAHAQTAQDGLSLVGAEGGIRIHGGHQDGGILVMLRLGRDEALEIDVDVTGEGDVVVVIDQHDLSGQVAALALVDLEMQVAEVEKSDLGQGLPELGDPLPGDPQPGGIHAPVSRQELADVQIGPVDGILLPKAVFPPGLGDQILGRSVADNDLIEVLHQAAVIRVGVGQQQALGGSVEIGDQGAQDGQGLLAVAGVAAVHAQKPPAAADHGGIAAAGGLDEQDIGLIRDLMGGDPRLEALAPVPGQQLRKAADAVKGAVGQQALLIQGLHGQVRVHQQALLLLIGQIQHAGQPPDEGAVEDAVVIGPGGRVVLDDLNPTDALSLLQKRRDPALILHIQSHPELLEGRVAALGIDVGNVEMEIVDQLQNRNGTAGLILEVKLQQHNAGIIPGILQIADLLQLRVGSAELFLGALHIQEEHVGIHSLVIADPGDIDAQLGKAPAGLQKGTDVVGQRGGIGFFHRFSSSVRL